MSEDLVGRRPDVAPDQLVADLVPPPHFAAATFDSYRPDDDYPSQRQALDIVRAFAADAGKRRRGVGGIYLDGGFGVGKTHLLAAAATAVGQRARFGTFVQYTSLVGALGFARARDELAQFRLVCIDEFELDDPGDTLIMARLIRELAERGVWVAATSNTPPGALGEGRFAAADFQREIQAIADMFVVVAIDGPDYRRRGEVEFAAPLDGGELAAWAGRCDAEVADWQDLVDDLAQVHPSRFGAYLDGVEHVALSDVVPLADQAQALRVVAFVDRMYDSNVTIAQSGQSLADIFGADMLAGGYRKKYLRALSRLAAMCDAGRRSVDATPV